MDIFRDHLLTWIIFSPLLGLVPLFLFPSGREKQLKGVVLALSLIPLGFSLWLFASFQGTGAYEFQEMVPWMRGYQAAYQVGVDGFSLLLICLTTFLLPLVLLATWNDVHRNVKGYLFFFLLLETGILGVFSALDLLLFYVFWEAALIPMYFLIGIWGGEERIYASIKFVLYTMVGSLLMLVAILYLYFAAGHSFYWGDMAALHLPRMTQIVLFAAFGLAFAIKVPLFPFHTWLPDAHVQAPTGGSVILAGVLLKMGTYGFARFAIPFFPEAVRALGPLLAVLSVIGIVYGALVSMVQVDMKKLVAYSSVSHLGFVVLGLFSLNAQGVSGATLQMINHGLSTGGLFFLVGMLYERRHTKLIADFGGLATSMPLYSTCFFIMLFSSIALPGTNGFIGEFLILLGSYQTHPILTTVATSGVIFAAIYMLWMAQRVFLGKVTPKNQNIADLSLREGVVLLPIIVLIFWIGFAPGFLLDKINPTTEVFLKTKTEKISIPPSPVTGEGRGEGGDTN